MFQNLQMILIVTNHALSYDQIRYIGRKKEKEMNQQGVELCRSTVIDRVGHVVSEEIFSILLNMDYMETPRD